MAGRDGTCEKHNQGLYWPYMICNQCEAEKKAKENKSKLDSEFTSRYEKEKAYSDWKRERGY